MKKLDLIKELKTLYSSSADAIELVKVPRFSFVMVDGVLKAGQRPASSPEFQEAVGALYALSYSLKFASKLRKANPIDYRIMPLEGLWSVDSGEFDFDGTEDWRWTLMIMQPKHITPAMFRSALKKVKEKKSGPFTEKLRFRNFAEGLSIQTMHIGPYADEPATIQKMETFAQEEGLLFRGMHHEIYLGDPRRAKPEKLKTILRHPVEKTS